MKKLTMLIVMLMATNSWSAEKEQPRSVDQAMRVLDSFMYSFNARDMDRWSNTLNYPHVRLAGGKVTVWKTKEDHSATTVFPRLVLTGWDHSAWVSREVILVSEKKVHISTIFQRFDKENNPIGKYQSLYIVTNDKGRWGVQARSSLAP